MLMNDDGLHALIGAVVRQAVTDIQDRSTANIARTAARRRF